MSGQARTAQEPDDERDPDGQAPDEVSGPQPPLGFDPLVVSQAELAYYGLPPRPDHEHEALLYRAFVSVFGPPLTFVDPRLEDVEFVGRQVPQPVTPIGTPSPYEVSDNWCGAYIEPNDGRMFVQIVGGWRVPTLSLPPPIDRVPPSPGAIYDCSTWIGLDGQRLCLDSSLPQIGTEQAMPAAGGPTTARGWFQWRARDETALHRKFFNGVPIAPGDDVRCMLWVKHSRRVHAFLRNYTTGKIAKVQARSPEVVLPDGTLTRPRVSGATAEWIMERPAIPPPKNQPSPSPPPLFPFPDYETTDFHNCVAGSAHAPGRPRVAGELVGVRYIRLIETCPAPARIVLLSMPTCVDSSTLRVRYGGFG